MGERRVRQGVRVKTVNEKRITDERYRQGLCLMLYTLLLVVIISMGQATYATLAVLGWMVLVPYSVYKMFNHIFVAEDGCYLVRWGWAVHIKWEQIKCTEVVVAYKHSRIRLCFLPQIVDEVTGTPVNIRKGLDDIIAYSETVLDCLKRHVPVTASAE